MDIRKGPWANVVQHKPRLAASQNAEPDEPYFGESDGDEGGGDFLELRFRTGMLVCFAYSDLTWFTYDPEADFLDLEFNGFLVTLKGSNLGKALFSGIKAKRVSWIREAHSENAEKPAGTAPSIHEILLTPPSTGEESQVEENEESDEAEE